MLLEVLVFFVLLAVSASLFGHDSRDGYDWRNYDEALKSRLGLLPTSR